MDFVWIAVWLALAINFWESSAITNKNNRGSKAQEERVRNFRHVENPTAYSNSDWEVGLRESTNQALLRENYRVPDLRHRLLSAPLIGKHDTATPFGDVAIVARGRLYATIGGDFVFVQEPFPSSCHSCQRHRRRCARSRCHQQVAHPHQDEQLVALWTVKRLRHRDYDNGYRYETEYTISPVGPLHDDALIAGINPLDYPLPGHVFVVKHSADAAHPVPPPVVYNQRPPHHHFRPEVLLGVGPDGNKHFLHSYPGFYTTSPYDTTEDPKEIELYKILVQALAAKTSTTHKIEDGPHRFSLNNLYTTEDSFTPLVQLPTGEMVPLTSATSQAPQTPGVFVTQNKATTAVLQMTPAEPTDLGPVESPASKTTVHYFAAADEDTSQTPGDIKEDTGTDRPSTAHVDDGADFLFPLETTTSAPNILYKAKTEIFPEQSVAPTRQSKLYHATFSANQASSPTPSVSSIPPTTTAFSIATTPTTQATITLETSKTTPTTISETIPTTRTSAAVPTATTSITTPATATPQSTPPATLATTPTKPTENGASRTIKLPPPTNLILKSSTTSKLDRPTTYRTKFTGLKASARFFPTTYKSSTTEKTTIGNTAAITSSTMVMTTPTTITSSTTPSMTELTTISSQSSTTNIETVSTVTSPMPSTMTGIDRGGTESKQKVIQENSSVTTATSIQTSQYATTEPTSMKTTTEDEDMEEMKFVLNPIPITPVKMTLVPESTIDLQTTKELPKSTSQETSTTTSQTEEKKTTQSMSSPDYTTLKTTMISGITTEASIDTTEAITTPTTEETTDITNTNNTAETTNASSTTTEENTMLKMFNDFFNQNKPSVSPTVEETDKTTEGITDVNTFTSTSTTTTGENMVVRMFNNLFNDDKSGTVEETEAVTNTSTAMTTEASSATTEQNMIKMFKDFLEEKTENKTPTKKDYTNDDIFGIPKNSEKPTVTTTTKAVESQFAGELFGNRRRSPQIYPPDLSLTKPTEIIYSDFYEASTTPMTDMEEEPAKPLTSQSYMTSISFKVNKKTKMADKDVREETGMPTESVSTTENGMEDKETKKALNDAALQLVNHVRSINYLNGVNSISSTARTKYKRRRTYIPKGRKVNIKKKI